MAGGAAAVEARAEGLHIVCGLGHVGYRVAVLLRRLGAAVHVIYNQASAEWLREMRAAGVECIEGDARDSRALERAGVRRARVVLAVTDQDLANLSVALDAKRLNPGIVTVIRLHDRGLARHVEEGLGARQVLSTSALAAPAFISAALAQEDIGYFTIDGHGFEAVCTEPSAAPPDGLALFRLRRGAAGSSLLSVRPLPQERGQPRRRRSVGRLGLASALLRQTPRIARTLAVALLAILALGVVVIHHAMGLPYGVALYFAVTTVTTVGYGDFSFHDCPLAVKLFGCLLMLSGAALLAALVGTVTDALVSYRLRDLLRRQPSRKENHIVVVGGGHIGGRIAEALARDGHELVALRTDAEGAEAADEPRVQVIAGDGRGDADLRLAGVGRAQALIAVHEDDVANLSVALQARKLNPGIRTVARVFDGVLAEKLQRELSIDAVLSVSASAAPAFVAAALCEDAVFAAVWEDHLVVIRAPGPGAAEAPRRRPTVRLAWQSGPETLVRLEPGEAVPRGARLLRAELLRLGAHESPREG